MNEQSNLKVFYEGNSKYKFTASGRRLKYFVVWSNEESPTPEKWKYPEYDEINEEYYLEYNLPDSTTYNFHVYNGNNSSDFRGEMVYITRDSLIAERDIKENDEDDKEIIDENKEFREILNTMDENVRKELECPICWEVAIEPLSCPKCYNFSCKKCIKSYFENKNKCPFCRENINFNDLKKNIIIEEIGKILNKNDDSIGGLTKLLKYINNKTMKEKEKSLNFLNKYKKSLNNYRNVLISFFEKSKNFIEKKIEIINKKTEELINTFQDYNNKIDESISKNDNTTKIIKNKNEKELINDILNMDRLFFNIKNKNSKEIFFNSDIQLNPRLYHRKLEIFKIEEKEKNGDFSYVNPISSVEDCLLGKYNINCQVDKKDGKYECTSKLTMTLKENLKEPAFIVNQYKLLDGELHQIINMKLIKKENNYYEFEGKINVKQNDFDNNGNIKVETEVMMFYL